MGLFWRSAAGLLLLGGSAIAQITLEPPTPVPPATMPAGAAPGSTGAVEPRSPAATQPVIPDAQRILQELVEAQGRGAAAATAATAIRPELGADGLLREGQLLENVPGRLHKDAQSGAMMFVFDAPQAPGAAAYPPMAAVPSQRLMQLENLAAAAGPDGAAALPVRITAEVTRYRGKNYLYIKKEADGAPAAGRPAAGALTPAAIPPTLVQQLDAAAPDEPPAIRMREADMISRRAARLMRDPLTGRQAIVFDADGMAMSDPPMGVIPGEMLQVMESLSDSGNRPVKFLVSGEVTSYRGRNYLLVRHVQQAREMNQGLGAGLLQRP